MRKRGPVLFLVALACYLVAWLIAGNVLWQRLVMQVLEAAGMVLFIFATYYSADSVLKEYRKGGSYFGGKSRNARMAMLAVFILSLFGTLAILVATKFPIGGLVSM